MDFPPSVSHCRTKGKKKINPEINNKQSKMNIELENKPDKKCKHLYN
jgi:hypothetical protein